MADPSHAAEHFLKRFRVLHAIRVRPRLAASALLGIAIFAAITAAGYGRWATRGLIAWDVGAIAYLALAWHMMVTSDEERMRRRALRQDDGRAAILMLTVVATLACLGAIVSELAVVKDLPRTSRLLHEGLAILTILTAWCFVHTMFALHYAHDYYLAPPGRTPALDFPGDDTPDYFDFLYFSFVIGTSGQTADVSIRSSRMRRVGLVHCTLAFFFNATVLALTINIAAGLIQP